MGGILSAVLRLAAGNDIATTRKSEQLGECDVEAVTVSELAARRHFADSSHVVKAYKKRCAETPTESR